MSAEVVFIFGPGATQRAASLASNVGTAWSFIPHEVAPSKPSAEPAVAIILMRKESLSDPFVQKLIVTGPPNRCPGVVMNDDLKSDSDVAALSIAIEKSWIRQCLEQFSSLGGDDFIAEMLELFQNQTEQFVEELASSLNASDAIKSRRIVHTLKSSFANYGGRHLQKAAQKLENEAAAGNLEVLKQQFDGFTKRTRDFRALLNSVATDFRSMPTGR